MNEGYSPEFFSVIGVQFIVWAWGVHLASTPGQFFSPRDRFVRIFLSGFLQLSTPLKNQKRDDNLKKKIIKTFQ